MLAVVRNPHIELSMTGDIEALGNVLALLRSRYPVEVLHYDPKEDPDETVNVFETDWWKTVTSGMLLAGCRMKHELTQHELAGKCGITQTVISSYETDKRKLTQKAAIKIGAALGEDPRKFFPKNAGKQHD